MTDFKAIIESLAAQSVGYIIIGGIAARAHGSSRYTEDIDLVYDRSEANILRLIKALDKFKPYLRGAPPGLPFVFDLPTIKSGLNFTLSTSAGAVDLLGEIVGGGTFATLADSSIIINLYGHDCKVLDLQTLIMTKKATGRPKDLDAVAELESLANRAR